MGPDTVLPLYEEGVRAVEAAVAGWPDDHWQQPLCGTWTASDLAGHLLCVARWYHDWLDRAEAGDPSPPFPVSELAARNQAAIDGLPATSGSARLALFSEEARRYATRLPAVWDLAYGYPFGTATAGLHAGAAASEWHLHAWDLSGGRHRPSDPSTLLAAVAQARLRRQGGVTGRVTAALLPLVVRYRPWEQLLRRAGRTPGPAG